MIKRYGSAKISKSILEKLLKSQATSKEIDLLLWLALRQDEFGRVFNIKYFDVCNNIGISYQEYYNACYNLEMMNFITIVARHNHYGWDIQINNNIHTSTEKNQYLNINKKVLFSSTFKKFRANEKKLTLKLLLLYGNIEKNIYVYQKTVKEWLNTENNQLIKSYINSLKKIFKITEDKKHGYIRFTILKNDTSVLEAFYQSNYSKSSSIFYHYMKNKLLTLLRFFNLQADEDKLNDLILLCNQRKEFSTIMWSTILNCFENGMTEPKYIQKIITSKLGLN